MEKGVFTPVKLTPVISKSLSTKRRHHASVSEASDAEYQSYPDKKSKSSSSSESLFVQGSSRGANGYKHTVGTRANTVAVMNTDGVIVIPDSEDEDY